MRTPTVYTASEIKNWHIAEEYEKGKWRPARCVGYFFLFDWVLWKVRFRISWKVFTGKYDALNWKGAGDKKNEETNYIDCLDSAFKTIKHS